MIKFQWINQLKMTVSSSFCSDRKKSSGKSKSCSHFAICNLDCSHRLCYLWAVFVWKPFDTNTGQQSITQHKGTEDDVVINSAFSSLSSFKTDQKYAAVSPSYKTWLNGTLMGGVSLFLHRESVDWLKDTLFWVHYSVSMMTVSRHLFSGHTLVSSRQAGENWQADFSSSDTVTEGLTGLPKSSSF